MKTFAFVVAMLLSGSISASEIHWTFAEAPSTWEALFEDSVVHGKPLCVWIGYRCPSSSDQVPGMNHFHVKADAWRDVKGPAVVVLLPNGTTDSMRRAGVVQAADCCAAELRRVVERGLAVIEAPPTVLSPSLGSWGMRPSAQPVQGGTLQRRIRGWSNSRTGACVG